jgi:hypothetical protein
MDGVFRIAPLLRDPREINGEGTAGGTENHHGGEQDENQFLHITLL